MRACSLIAECSLAYAKIMQTSGKKACFQFPECSLSYAKITYPTYIRKKMNQKMNRLHADSPSSKSNCLHENRTKDRLPDSQNHTMQTAVRQRRMTEKTLTYGQRERATQPTDRQHVAKEAL